MPTVLPQFDISVNEGSAVSGIRYVRPAGRLQKGGAEQIVSDLRRGDLTPTKGDIPNFMFRCQLIKFQGKGKQERKGQEESRKSCQRREISH